MKHIIIRVDWDTESDGKKHSLKSAGLLPFVVVFDLPDEFDENDGDSEIHDRISDLLSDKFGWCHFGWSIELDKGELPREALLMQYVE